MKRFLLAVCLLLAAEAANAHAHPFRLEKAVAAGGRLPQNAICTAAGPVIAPVLASPGDETQRWVALGPFLLLVGVGAVRGWRRQRPPR